MTIIPSTDLETGVVLTGQIHLPQIPYGDNVYYSPEKLGLETFGEAEDDEACYSFSKFVVWRTMHLRPRFYYADDWGCSCPAPFEDYRSLADLNCAEDIAEIHRALDEWEQGYPGRAESAAELHAKLAQVRQ